MGDSLAVDDASAGHQSRRVPSDGNGVGAAIQFATFAGSRGLVAGDFTVI